MVSASFPAFPPAGFFFFRSSKKKKTHYRVVCTLLWYYLYISLLVCRWNALLLVLNCIQNHVWKRARIRLGFPFIFDTTNLVVFPDPFHLWLCCFGFVASRLCQIEDLSACFPFVTWRRNLRKAIHSDDRRNAMQRRTYVRRTPIRSTKRLVLL